MRKTIEIPTYPRITIIGGEGKKTGKTTMVCKLIKNFPNRNVHAIKVSSHIHELTERQKILLKSADYTVSKDLETEPIADSSRFMHAGALKSYYIQTCDDYLYEALLKLLELEKLTDVPVVIESSSLIKYLQPAFSIFMARKEQEMANNQSELFDMVLNLDDLANFDIKQYVKLNMDNTWEVLGL